MGAAVAEDIDPWPIFLGKSAWEIDDVAERRPALQVLRTRERGYSGPPERSGVHWSYQGGVLAAVQARICDTVTRSGPVTSNCVAMSAVLTDPLTTGTN